MGIRQAGGWFFLQTLALPMCACPKDVKRVQLEKQIVPKKFEMLHLQIIKGTENTI